MYEQWLNEYEKNYSTYQEIIEQTKLQLQGLFKQENFHIHMIDARIKTKFSIKNKLEQNIGRYHQLSDITDICGIRIITYYADELDTIAAQIRECFAINEENCVDKRKILAANSFGYLSLHLILEIPYGEIKYKVEVQIRSFLQHAWAAIEHELAYKNKMAESYELRRSFSRLASTLESVDLEFLKIRNLVAEPKPLEKEASEIIEQQANYGWNGILVVVEWWKRNFSGVSGAVSCIIMVSATISLIASIYYGTQALALVTQLSSLLKNV